MNNKNIVLILTLLLLPIIIKLYKSKNLLSDEYKNNRKKHKLVYNLCSLNHLFQGVISGILLRGHKKTLNILGKNAYSLFIFLITVLYPIYNYVKRVFFKKNFFWNSSYFLNLNDFTVGVIIGVLLNNKNIITDFDNLTALFIVIVLIILNICSYYSSKNGINTN